MRAHANIQFSQYERMIAEIKQYCDNSPADEPQARLEGVKNSLLKHYIQTTDEKCQQLIEALTQFDFEALLQKYVHLSPAFALYQKNVDKAAFQAVYPLMIINDMISGKQSAFKHTFHLLVLLGEQNNSQRFLRDIAKQHPATVALAIDAVCAELQLPTNNQWNMDLWLSIFRRHLSNQQALKLIPLARLPELQNTLQNTLQGYDFRTPAEVEHQKQTREQLQHRCKALREQIKALESVEMVDTENVENAAAHEQRLSALRAELANARAQIEALPTRLKNTSQLGFNDLRGASVQVQYPRATPDDIDAALLFLRYRLPETLFNQYLELKPTVMNSDAAIPRLFVDGKEEGFDNYYLCKMSQGDPKGLLLGEITSCCQTLGKSGEPCAIDGFISPDSDFYIVCKGKPPAKSADGHIDTNNIKRADIIACSWAVKAESGAIILDSIEIQPQLQSIESYIAVCALFNKCAEKIIRENPDIPRVTVGKAGRTPIIVGSHQETITPERPLSYRHPKTDATMQRLVFDQAMATNALPARSAQSELAQFREIAHSQDMQAVANYIVKLINDNSDKTKVERFNDFMNTLIASTTDTILIDNVLEAMLAYITPARDQALKALALNAVQQDYADLLKFYYDKGVLLYDYSTDNNAFYYADTAAVITLLLERDKFEPLQPEDAFTAAKLAIINNNVDLLDKALVHLGDVNNIPNPNIEPKSLLMIAVKANKIDMVNHLILKGANVDRKDDNYFQNTPLICALENKHLDIAQLLLNKGASIHERSRSRKSPLMAVLPWGKTNLFERILKKIKNEPDSSEIINKKDSHGTTALGVAVSHQQSDCVKMLLEAGAKIDLDSMRELLIAALDGSKEIVELILKHEPNVDLEKRCGQDHTTLLIQTVLWYKDEITKILLEHGADPNKYDKYGETPLICAARTNRLDLVKMLLSHGADPNLCHEREPKNALQVALDNINPLIVAELLTHGATHSIKINSGMIDWRRELFGKNLSIDDCLYRSVDYHHLPGQKEIAKVLLQHGANPNVKQKNGDTPLGKAVYDNKDAYVELLLAHGADPNQSAVDQEKPLTRAIKNKNVRIVQLLVSYGASFNAAGYHKDNIHKLTADKSIINAVLAESFIEKLQNKTHRVHHWTFDKLPKNILNYQRINGESLLTIAISNDHPECAKTMIKQGLVFNDSQKIPFARALATCQQKTADKIFAAMDNTIDAFKAIIEIQEADMPKADEIITQCLLKCPAELLTELMNQTEISQFLAEKPDIAKPVIENLKLTQSPEAPKYSVRGK